MKKTTALAAVLAVTLMLGACTQTSKPEPSTEPTETTISSEETTTTEETTAATTGETTSETTTTGVKELHEPNLFGNPDLDNPVSDWFYRSKDVESSWIDSLMAFYGLYDWNMTSPIVAGSELTAEFEVNPEGYGDTIKLYVFDHNDDYAWNTKDAYTSFEATFCRTVNADQYYGTGYLPADMETGVYTLVVTRPDGTVECMYDFDVAADFDEAEAMPVDKPVIYLYPEETTDVDVKIDFEGQLECTYPKYDPENGWHVVADPDGRIHNTNDGRDYDYLFWEGTTYNSDLKSFNNAICVRGCDTEDFLEEYLEAAGLNSSEIDDFISFWLPMMEKNEYNLISFPTEEYENIAKLNVSPAPDTVIRVYMVFAGVDHEVEIASENQLVMPSGVTRDGFTVVEWGGSPVALAK